MPKPRKKTVGPKRAAIQARGVARRNQALELRKKGATYQQIAETLRGTPGIPKSYCKANAYRDVMAELNGIIAANGEAAESVRVMEIMRLDRLLVALDDGIEAGDPSAINTAIRIGESRRKLLGLDAPDKSAVEITGGMTIVAPDRFETAEEWQKQAGK